MEEYSSITKNNVWEVVPRPEGKLVVTSRWLYKIKHVADGSIEKFKAQFLARGFVNFWTCSMPFQIRAQH